MTTIYANLNAITKTLANIEKWLDKAEEYAASKSFDPAVLLGARLAPDHLDEREDRLDGLTLQRIKAHFGGNAHPQTPTVDS